MAKEVATQLNCRPEHIRLLVKRGLLKPVRLSPEGWLRFRAEDVERLIAGEDVP
jgi:DNA-binding transcriptional MerR regulator